MAKPQAEPPAEAQPSQLPPHEPRQPHATAANSAEAPHAVDAERAVLGALLLNNELFAKVTDLLKPEFFYDKRHRLIYETAYTLYDKGSVDPLILAQRLRDSGKMAEAGGAEYIAELADIGGAPVNIPSYAELITDAAFKRVLITAHNDGISESYRPNGKTPPQLLDAAEGRLSAASDTFRRNASAMRPLAEVAEEFHDKIVEHHQNLAALRGVHVGFNWLYKMTHGFRGGDLVILAGRPGTGKTAFGLNVIRHVAGQENSGVLCFSLEMSAEQLAMRLLAHHGMDMHRTLRAEEMSSSTLAQFTSASSKLETLNLTIDDSSTLNILEARTRARRIKREMARNGIALKMIMVDYLQLMDGPGGGRNETRALEVSLISRGLKALAKELDAPVLALSQLNRSGENRPDSRPVMSDLRESGAIEQDADTILFLYPKKADKKVQYKDSETPIELIIGKQRNGPTGVVYMTFDKPMSTFKENSSTRSSDSDADGGGGYNTDGDSADDDEY